MRTALALAEALPDFGLRASRGAIRAVEPPAQNNPPAIDIAALVQAEIALAEATLTARLEEAHRAEREAERLAHAEALADLRRDVGDRAGPMIAAAMSGAEERIAALVTEATARILLPVLTADMHARSLARLSQAIRDAIRDADSLRVVVTGPQSLQEALARSMGEDAGRLHFVDGPGFDLAVSVGERLLETRFGEWADALAGLVDAMLVAR